MSAYVSLSKTLLAILKMLREKAKPEFVYVAPISQSELASKLGVTRQALNMHLRKLAKMGLARSGRGFIEITEKGLAVLGEYSKPAFVLISVEPTHRTEVYETVKKMGVVRVSRLSGDVDLMVEVSGSDIPQFLGEVSKLPGVKQTKTYFVLETLK
ncbi:MAG TPA: Lrp/AsnC family transcriptional regulator [Armatimonadetes bacterium]|nr:Lrp/AsnC family transcriptional regulator [Armatimonadota bacterium]